MTSLSIDIPQHVLEASTKTAKELKISRVEFIRRAITNELEKCAIKREEEAIIASFNAMKRSPKYLKEAKEIESSLFDDLPEEEDNWWQK